MSRPEFFKLRLLQAIRRDGHVVVAGSTIHADATEAVELVRSRRAVLVDPEYVGVLAVEAFNGSRPATT
jgi:hypothetical protein